MQFWKQHHLQENPGRIVCAGPTQSQYVLQQGAGTPLNIWEELRGVQRNLNIWERVASSSTQGLLCRNALFCNSLAKVAVCIWSQQLELNEKQQIGGKLIGRPHLDTNWIHKRLLFRFVTVENVWSHRCLVIAMRGGVGQGRCIQSPFCNCTAPFSPRLIQTPTANTISHCTIKIASR